MLFSQLPEITDGTIANLIEDREISHLLIDSRKLVKNHGALFFALKGNNHDGHSYIKIAHSKGVRQFVVEGLEKVATSDLKNSNFLIVENAIDALQKIAEAHRRQFNLCTIGITGSNGKTIVKEWLSQLLAEQFSIVKSPKSYNSQVGVPLSIWQINEKHEVGVFEAGVSQTDEMARLEKMIKPDIGIFTSLGPAHDEGFENVTQKQNEKLNLFEHCPKIIYCLDHPIVCQGIEERYGNSDKSLISWSTSNENANYYYKLESGKIYSSGVTYQTDETSKVAIENLLHCLTACHELGLNQAHIEIGLKKLSPIEMRLELKKGAAGNILIDDTYSNDLASLEIALDFAIQQKTGDELVLILSDILQSGVDEKQLYQSINKLILEKNVTELIGIGADITASSEVFKLNTAFYKSTEEFLKNKHLLKLENAAILVKGARNFRFERIVETLQEKLHGTQLTIDLDAISHNLNTYRNLLNPETKLMVMVKALAYGGGSTEIGNLLQYHQVDYLAVAYPDEGIEIRKQGITLPIMVMNSPVESFKKMAEYDLEPEIYSPGHLRSFIREFERDAFPNVHLKLDTGMHRLGFEVDQIEELIGLLKANPAIKVASIFSHLAASDNPDLDTFTSGQIKLFDEMSSRILTKLEIKPLRHILNTSGISRWPNDQFDMVRLGIGLYGIDSNPDLQRRLENVGTLTSTISQVKNIRQGESVGYGRAHIAKSDQVIATIAIGYADGYDRRFGNGCGRVLINGKLALVVGNICMDMTMVDISEIDAKVGDEVTIFGYDLPVTQLADWIGTIPYEILTDIGNRVKRVYKSA
ncbi:MAG: bifunctional UDP-N-acetylmuramoyl-tripeptide:D-alanyl-D-alanine ligase/alanine racemase [Cyclobacteriaceae bacterium]